MAIVGLFSSFGWDEPVDCQPTINMGISWKLLRRYVVETPPPLLSTVEMPQPAMCQQRPGRKGLIASALRDRGPRCSDIFGKLKLRTEGPI